MHTALYVSTHKIGLASNQYSGLRSLLTVLDGQYSSTISDAPTIYAPYLGTLNRGRSSVVVS